MICSRCKKRMAVVFMTRMEGDKTINEGLCLACAKELGIKPVNDMMEKMGISDDDIDNMGSELMELMEDQDENFEPGGAQTFPFLQNLFGNKNMPENSSPNSEKKQSKMPGRESAKVESKKKFLNNYCVHLTEKARQHELDPIIGRDKEISRVIQILSRRTKNNPCLIGEPGVGKTAIAEGIAQKIVQGEVPFRLSDKEVYLLDLTALVAGTQFRGQFEGRVKGLVDEVKAEGNVILFIDEVHNLVGTGDSEGSMNAANILKPALSRGEIQVIGATTFNEYRKYIEKDSALERRFQPVRVEEPSIDETYDMLKGIRLYYENFHRVSISDDILKKAVVLSERYITDRFLPDKAIDLMDEACSRACLSSKELAEYEKINKELKTVHDEIDALEQAVENVDYQRTAQLKAEACQLTTRQLELEPAATSIRVTEYDLAKVIELWTGIPAARIQEAEMQKVCHLEDALKAKVVGQDEACRLVANAIKRSRVQLSKRRRPASFIFVGPTGVGKTELVKVLAAELFDTVDPLIRLDMSEFMDKYSVSRIIGAPPGYVGYDEAGQLTEKVRRKPYSVVLFDEIEKAHPDVMNILLQILDEGKVNDAHGRTVSFENTVIVMTSNAGSERKDLSVGFNKQPNEIVKDRAMKSLSEFLRPEFLSRVDEVVVFNNLTRENFIDIAALMLGELKDALGEKSIAFEFDRKALEYLSDKAFGGKFSARDLRNVIRKEVEDKLASLLVERFENAPGKITLSVGDGLIITAL